MLYTPFFFFPLAVYQPSDHTKNPNNLAVGIVTLPLFNSLVKKDVIPGEQL
jgi:hypothetical protein